MLAISLAILWSSIALWSNMTFLEAASALSTFILIVGAVWEDWEKVKGLTLLTLKRLLRRSNPVERCALTKLAIHSIGPILVIAGITGELVFETRTFVVGDTQTASDELQIAKLQKDNLELKPIADKAEKDLKAQEKLTADEEERAYKAQKDAESEKIEMIKLEALVGPRRLTAEQQNQIGSACANLKFKNLPSNRIMVNSYGLDGEGAGLGAEIVGALTSSKLYSQANLAGFIVSGGFETGVLISAPPEDIPFAQCFAEALINVGHLKEVRVNSPRNAANAVIGGGVTMSGVTMEAGLELSPEPHLQQGLL